MMEQQLETEATAIKKQRTDYTGGWGIVLLEVLYIFIVHMGYPFFSVQVFREGMDAFMYSDSNMLMYFLLIIVPPTAMNVILFLSRRKKQRPVLRYIIAQIIVLALFALLLTDNYMAV